MDKDESGGSMLEEERLKILEQAKKFFKEKIADQHVKRTLKLTNLTEFNANPFLLSYLAYFLTGNGDPQSMAKALIYPRVLGTSITTSFGQNTQNFCHEVLSGFPATTSGMDIEFIDQIDGRKKYCQIKSGPNTINADDVSTIEGHFRQAMGLFRQNRVSFQMDDLVIGVFYGEDRDLSVHYKKLLQNYSVYVGKEFWMRLTGSDEFYSDMIDVFGQVAKEIDASQLLSDVIDQLAKQFSNE